MKSCIYCGNTLEDQAQFCNRCGQRQQPQYQQPQYQQPQYQAPQYQQPQYQVPQYQYAPTPVYSGSPDIAPSVNSIGLFNLIGAITTTILGYLLNFLVPGMIGGVFYSMILPWIWSAVYFAITGIGLGTYNKKCIACGRPEKKLGFGWLFLVWGIREVISFVFGFIWGVCTTFIYTSSIPVVTIGIIAFVANLIINLGSALLTWLIGGAILKSVVKNK